MSPIRNKMNRPGFLGSSIRLWGPLGPGPEGAKVAAAWADATDRERLYRDNQRRTRLLRGARLKVAQASIEDINYKAARGGLDKRQIAQLATGEWVRRAQNLLITGATGSGRTWIACALAQQTCREGHSVLYWRMPRLIEELRIAHDDGSYIEFLKSLSKAALIVLGHWGFSALSAQDRADLLEVLDDRIDASSTLIASQLPGDTWHAYLGEPTLADAILDRLIHQSHRIDLQVPGESMRENRATADTGASPRPDGR